MKKSTLGIFVQLQWFAIVKKINNKLFKPEKIYSREYMIKNS